MADKRTTGAPPPTATVRAVASAPGIIRLRPIDGGLQNDGTGEFVPKDKASAMRDVLFYKNELRKALGGDTLVSFDYPIAWCGVWKRLSGVSFPVVLTTRTLHYRAGNTWIAVSSGDITDITGTADERVNVVFIDDKMYFNSYDYELRVWDSGATHKRVADGYASRTMDTFNNRIILGGTIENGEARAQTARWTANGVVNFTAPGSGAFDFADRDDIILKIKKYGPFRGLVFKEDSIHDMRATGSLDLPFENNEILPLGLYAANAVVETPRGLIFPGSDGQIYMIGQTLTEIGNDIFHEFFENLNPSARHKAIGHWDALNKEAILIIPTGTDPHAEPSLYYAYNTQKKRWRSGVYTNATSIGKYHTVIGISWDEDEGTWDQATDTWNDETGIEINDKILIGTLDKKVILLDETKFSFNGVPLSFEYVTGDIVGKIDGAELTLTEVIIGYVVDGVATLNVSASVDRGNTFEKLTTINLGGPDKRNNKIAYARASIIITGESIRVKIANNNQNHKIRIVSISARVSETQASREEALQ